MAFNPMKRLSLYINNIISREVLTSLDAIEILRLTRLTLDKLSLRKTYPYTAL
jgi:hypothetical protein